MGWLILFIVIAILFGLGVALKAAWYVLVFMLIVAAIAAVAGFINRNTKL